MRLGAQASWCSGTCAHAFRSLPVAADGVSGDSPQRLPQRRMADKKVILALVAKPATQYAHSLMKRNLEKRRQFADIVWQGRSISIEYEWLNRERTDAPLMLFLHEGLGSLSMWRDFPARLCEAAGIQGLVFSRYGYGHSTTRSAQEQWGGDFVQVQATELIPSFLKSAGVRPDQPLWLFGHSDGGSIALIMAAHDPARYAGVIVAAPHTSIDALTAQGVSVSRKAFFDGVTKTGLQRHHADAQSVVMGWADSWLTPESLQWTIVPLLASITCPLLAIQGEHDAYGMLEQIRVIPRHVPHARLLELKDCGHIPHFEMPDTVIKASVAFMQSVCDAGHAGAEQEPAGVPSPE